VNQPLVSVICLCFNHKKFIERAVKSVLEQTYENIELIIVDDASKDGSSETISSLSKQLGIKAILNPTNLGNCKSFNLAFKVSKGDYIIDLAADDVLFPGRVQTGVEVLEQKGKNFGVHFCDIELIDEQGKTLGTHFKRNPFGQLIETVTDGDIYKTLLEKYYISTPTMMIRREVLEKLGGYDESLSYEDFDFWVRSSRDFQYCFTNQVQMQKQIISHSHSTTQYQRKNPHCLSTAKVCKKALNLNTSPEENMALLIRVNYELKWALITENWEAAQLFIKIKDQLPGHSLRFTFEKSIATLRPRWYGLWKPFIH